MPRPPVRPLTAAQQALALTCLPAAHKFSAADLRPGAGDDGDDLTGAAYVALCRAARGFDPERGTMFSTYAVRSIRRAVRQARDEAETARCRRREAALAVFHARGEGYRDPDPAEADGLAAALHAGVAGLDARAQFALRLRFWEGATLAVVGDALGVSKERARQLIAKACGRLRRSPALAGGGGGAGGR